MDGSIHPFIHPQLDVCFCGAFHKWSFLQTLVVLFYKCLWSSAFSVSLLQRTATPVPVSAETRDLWWTQSRPGLSDGSLWFCWKLFSCFLAAPGPGFILFLQRVLFLLVFLIPLPQICLQFLFMSSQRWQLCFVWMKLKKLCLYPSSAAFTEILQNLLKTSWNPSEPVRTRTNTINQQKGVMSEQDLHSSTKSKKLSSETKRGATRGSDTNMAHRQFRLDFTCISPL